MGQRPPAPHRSPGALGLARGPGTAREWFLTITSRPYPATQNGRTGNGTGALDLSYTRVGLNYASPTRSARISWHDDEDRFAPKEGGRARAADNRKRKPWPIFPATRMNWPAKFFPGELPLSNWPANRLAAAPRRRPARPHCPVLPLCRGSVPFRHAPVLLRQGRVRSESFLSRPLRCGHRRNLRRSAA